jgi:medium-chain acyl-[acyl-carrier-protein] hydrolase
MLLPALLKVMHDTAQEHASAAGFGYLDLLPLDLSWALASMEVEVCGVLPKGGEKIEVSTGINRHIGPIVFRDYLVHTGGVELATAQAMWVLIDVNSRKTARPAGGLREVLATIEAPLQNSIGRVKRLSPQKTDETIHSRKVHYHDLDFNAHLNNAIAVEWILDAAFEQVRRGGNQLPRVRRLQLSYHHEALLGEELDCGIVEQDAPLRMELRSVTQGGRPVASAVVGMA